MKIVLIRHARVDYPWRSMYLTSKYKNATIEYDYSAIFCNGMGLVATDDLIYTSTLSRSIETARCLFGDGPHISSELFDEVPVTPFVKLPLILPTICWDRIGRFLWRFSHGGQTETKKATMRRAHLAIDLIEANEKDAYVVSHAFYMRALFDTLKKRGYRCENMTKTIDNLYPFVFEKK